MRVDNSSFSFPADEQQEGNGVAAEVLLFLAESAKHPYVSISLEEKFLGAAVTGAAESDWPVSERGVIENVGGARAETLTRVTAAGETRPIE